EGAHLAVACAAAAELDGNEGGEDLVLLQRAIVSRDEAVFRVALGGALGKAWSDLARERLEVDMSGHDRSLRAGHMHRVSLTRPHRQLQNVKLLSSPRVLRFRYGREARIRTVLPDRARRRSAGGALDAAGHPRAAARQRALQRCAARR